MKVYYDFSNKALRAFSSIIKKYGLKVASDEECKIRLETSDVFLVLYFDKLRSYEVGCYLGLLKEPERSYELREIVKFVDTTGKTEDPFFQADSETALDHCLEKICKLIERYADPFLQGNQDAYKALGEWRRQESLRDLSDRIRSRSTELWRQGNYRGYIDLLTPYEQWLSESEKKKLAYAHKQAD